MNKWWLLLFLIPGMVACSTKSPELPENPSLEGKTTRNYYTFAIGGALYSDPGDPLFKYLSLDERIRKEVAFNLSAKGIDYSSENPEFKVYYYFLHSFKNPLPILPYHITLAEASFQTIYSDTLQTNESLFITDFVELSTNTLIWRDHFKVIKDSEKTITQSIVDKLPLLLRRFPG